MSDTNLGAIIVCVDARLNDGTESCSPPTSNRKTACGWVLCMFLASLLHCLVPHLPLCKSVFCDISVLKWYESYPHIPKRSAPLKLSATRAEHVSATASFPNALFSSPFPGLGEDLSLITISESKSMATHYECHTTVDNCNSLTTSCLHDVCRDFLGSQDTPRVRDVCIELDMH